MSRKLAGSGILVFVSGMADITELNERFVCVYVFMYVCMYVCMYVQQRYLSDFFFKSKVYFMYAYVNVGIYASLYVCMHVCMYVCMHVCMYVFKT